MGEPAWVTKHQEDVGAWIKLNLDGVYRLTKIMVMGRPALNFKDISLEFLNGEPVHFTLEDNIEWQTIKLDRLLMQDIITDYVKISVLSIYIKSDDGFRELKVFGHPSGTSYDNNVTRHYFSEN